ncbi:MAG: replicative DNA helicase [Pseudomonadota bacterium]
MANLDSNIVKLAPEGGTPAFRSAPHNIEAEQALLGAILINNDAFYRVSDFLEADHFFETAHKDIYQKASDLIRAGKLADPRTLMTFLPAETEISGMTVKQYVARLAAEATTIINALDYGRTIQDLSKRRNLIGIGTEMVNVAFDTPVDFNPQQQIEEIERQLYALAEADKFGKGFAEFKRAAARAVEMTANAYKRDGKLSGLATGLDKLDHDMGGLQKSDLIVLAGRPGMGKTALATNIAFNVASNYVPEHKTDGTLVAAKGGIVGFFSLEMSAEQLATRIISEQTEISSSAMRRGEISPTQFDVIAAASTEMENLPFYIDESGGLSISQLAARARRLKRQRGLDLLVVDYIQLLQGSGRRSDNRVQEVTEITTGLKALAKELDVPVVALSQLSRQVESRDDKRPQLSDLRESGSIEQDADVVLFVYREEYYLKGKEPPKPGGGGSDDSKKAEAYAAWQRDLNNAEGKAEIIISKQRHGPTGTVEVHFDGQFTRFSNLADAESVPARR